MSILIKSTLCGQSKLLENLLKIAMHYLCPSIIAFIKPGPRDVEMRMLQQAASNCCKWNELSEASNCEHEGGVMWPKTEAALLSLMTNN